MSAYAYAVVLFEGEGCVGIAYKTWIESREDALFCYWPQDSISALKRAKRKEMPDKDMWTRHKVMVISYTDDFDQAQRRAQKAEYTDNVATEDEMVRRRKVPKRYESTTDNEESDDGLQISASYTTKDPVLPAQPTKFRKGTNTDESLNVMQCTIPSSNNNQRTPTPTNTQPSVSQPRSQSASLLEAAKESTSTASTAFTDDDFKTEFREKLDVVLRNQQKIMDMLKQREEEEPLVVEDVVPTPMETNHQLLEFNAKLDEDQKLRKKLITVFMSLSGGSLAEYLRRVMYKIATPAVWSTYNMKGHGQKKAFVELRLYRILLRTSRKIDYKISQIEFDEVVGKVLKHAPSKQGGYRFKDRSKPLRTDSKDSSVTSVDSDS